MPIEKMSEETTQEGGCLCGDIRYRVTGAALNVEYCHCGMCRKAGGAPTVVWVDFPRDRVVWVRGTPALYQSSERAQRGFCPRCGSALLFQWEGADFVSLTLGTLDHPEVFPPQSHIYEADRVPWLRIADDSPRHPASRPKAAVQ